MKNTAINTLIISLICFAQFKLSAQTKGAINIKGDIIYLDSLIEKNIAINKLNKTIPGFRIQIFSGNERNNANNIKTHFLKLYPNQTAYLAYQQPYFKIRIGDFKTRLEAKLFYNKIKEEFGECIIIADKINLPAVQ
ncbi:MAG: SPOR domain-containing protein [Candidatus Methylacidiphilales bacterium]